MIEIHGICNFVYGHCGSKGHSIIFCEKPKVLDLILVFSSQYFTCLSIRKDYGKEFSKSFSSYHFEKIMSSTKESCQKKFVQWHQANHLLKKLLMQLGMDSSMLGERIQ